MSNPQCRQNYTGSCEKFHYKIPSLLIKHLRLKKNIGDILLVSEWTDHIRLHLYNTVNTWTNWVKITFLCKWVPVDGAWCFTSIGREKGLCLYSVAWRLLIPRGIPAELIVICEDWGWVWVEDTSEGKISWSIKLLPIVKIGMALVSSS